MENQGLNKIRVSIDDGTPIINKTASNPRYPRLEPSRVSHTPHSHSIVLSHGSALNLQRKFFLDTIGDRRASPSIKSALDFSTEISATRNLLGFSDYRHRSVDFRHPPQRTTIRLAAEKYRRRQWHDPCAKLNGSHRRSWRTSFPITLYGPTCWLGRSGPKRRAPPIARPSRSNRTPQDGAGWNARRRCSSPPESVHGRGRFGTARSGERRIRTGGHRFVGWRSASAKAPNGRHSSASTSGPFRSAVTHLARPSRAYPAGRHQEHP